MAQSINNAFENNVPPAFQHAIQEAVTTALTAALPNALIAALPNALNTALPNALNAALPPLLAPICNTLTRMEIMQAKVSIPIYIYHSHSSVHPSIHIYARCLIKHKAVPVGQMSNT